VGQSEHEPRRAAATSDPPAPDPDVLRLDPEAVQWREVQGEVIAIDLRNGRYLTTNPSGALLWPLLARGSTVEQLSAALRDCWPLDPRQSHEDANRFVAWLRQQNLLLAPAG
jgi:hypothetical protein